jgi:hypothetical protein
MPRTMRTSVLALASIAAAAACEAGGSSPGVIERDSADVRIVESREPAWDESEGWRLSEEPLLEIGVLDGAEELQFSNVRAAFRMPDGRIVVADQRGQPGMLRFFGPDGSYLHAVGTSGSGPGEFSNLTQVAPYRGDSIAVYDASARRLTVFDDSGRLGRTGTIEIPEMEAPAQGSLRLVAIGSVLGFLGDGSLVLQPMTALAGDPGDVIRPDVRYLITNPDGEPRDTLGPFPGGEMLLPDFGAAVSLQAPFPRRTLSAFHGHRIFIGLGSGDHEVRVHDADGTLRRIYRATHRDLSLDEAAREAYRESQRDRADDEQQLREVERSLRDVRFPATLTPYSRLLVDTEGNLWTRDERIPGVEGPDRWQVFDPDGRLLGEVEIPQRLNVQQIGADFVLGSWTDDLDVPYVRLYALEREGA